MDGVERVRFKKPVITYIDNFLGFDVGGVVPVGYYDRDRAVWVPSDNGVVVRLLDTDADGIVDALDADGDELPDDLDEDGLYEDEVEGLDDPQVYAPDATYWRVAIFHFTSWDCNWPSGLPPDAEPPNPDGEPYSDGGGDGNGDGGDGSGDGDDGNNSGDGDDGEETGGEDKPRPCTTPTGSYVKDRTRVLHEDIPIPGADMRLHYSSNRVDRYKTVITVPASGEDVPGSVKRIIVRIHMAGLTQERVLDPLPNQIVEFVWDGLDCSQREVRVPINAYIHVGFVYDEIYYIPDDWAQAFAQAGGDITTIQTRQEKTLWKCNSIRVTPPETRMSTAGIAEGWSLSSNHFFDSFNLTLYKGNGTVLKDETLVINTVAGNSNAVSAYGSPSPAYYFPWGVEVDDSGNFYISDPYNHCVVKLDVGGNIVTVAGSGTEGYSGDGGPAVDAQLFQPSGMAADGNGNLYVADSMNHCIRKIDSQGRISTIAGTGTEGYSGDGGPASEARLRFPADLAIGNNGLIYVADTYNHAVRVIEGDGTIRTLAGDGMEGYAGDGGAALEAKLSHPAGIVIGPSGQLFVSDSGNHCIRKIDFQGVIRTIAGNGRAGYSGDNGLAAAALLNQPLGIAFDSEGNLYVSDSVNLRIRRISAEGIITTMAGNGTEGLSGDGGPALQAQFGGPAGIVMDGHGNLYVADTYNQCLRKIDSDGIIDSIPISSIGDGGLATLAARRSSPLCPLVHASNACVGLGFGRPYG